MKTLSQATELRIRHLEELLAACVTTIAAEKELLRIQLASTAEASTASVRTGTRVRRLSGPNGRPTAAPLSSRRLIVQLLEDNYPRDFDPQDVAHKTGVMKRSNDGRLSTYSLLARLYREGKIDKHGTGRYRALPPAKRPAPRS